MQQVVVREDPEAPLAFLHLVADLESECDPSPGRGVSRFVGRLEPGLWVPDGGPCDGHRLGEGEGGVVLGERERSQVEVVDDLAQQLVEVLHQPGPGIGVTRHAQRAQHHRAELVGGRDRRTVKTRQCLGHPAVPEHPLLVVAVDEQVDQGRRLRGPDGLGSQGALGLDQLGADALAQLLAGRSAERDDQHLLEPALPLGDVAGHQCPDGPGLAGAGTGLQQGGAGRQRVADVERVRARHSAATFSAPVSKGSQTCQAYVVSPASRRSDSGARSP